MSKKIPYIPEGAPFSGEQKQWLGGFLAGINTRALAPNSAQASQGAGASQQTIDIIFGTQTGTAEMIAQDAAAVARSKGLAPRLAEMDEVTAASLASMDNLLVIVSTYGEGEMPDNAHQFWEDVSASTTARVENLNYSVLALGDTSYEHFCQAGKLVDTRLEQLGGRRLHERVDCDVEYEEHANAWIEKVITVVAASSPQRQNAASAPASEPQSKAKTAPKWGRKNPFLATILDNRNLSGANSAKEIRHIAFDLAQSGMSYEAGDALGVLPVNSPTLIKGFLERLGAKADDKIEGHDAPLGELLATGFEIMTPPRTLIHNLEPIVKNDELSRIIGNGDKEALEHYLWGKDTLDLLNLAPSIDYDAAEVLSWLKPLQHRAYSISSSPKAHPGEVHLTVAAVRWMYDERQHNGVCSTFLADYVPEGQSAGIFMSPNKSFRVPQDDSVPMIMIGPGTGIAPFRAFLEERRERGASGNNWLFFGDQHRKSDFIYEDEIKKMSEDGILNRLDLAFSRDQSEKIYVQNRMLENGKELFAQLQEGGHFYVCGDATRMAKDVDAVLHEIIAAHGAMSEEAAKDYVKNLKREKRYVRDVY